MPDTEKSVDLNENPAIPDTSGVGDTLMKTKGPSLQVIMGNFIVNQKSNTAEGSSLEEEIKKVHKDTSAS